MIFRDREDAARQMVTPLEPFRAAPNTIILALPRGGVVLGRILADALQLPLDIVVPRKIPAPENEEYAIGAITETGEPIWNTTEHARISDEYAKRVILEEQTEAKRRLALYRPKGEPRNLLGKTVLVIDDGIATGLTMRAAIATIRQEGAARIIIAVPVCPPDTKMILQKDVDECIVLDTPEYFGAIGNFYERFPQVEDETVIKLLKTPQI